MARYGTGARGAATPSDLLTGLLASRLAVAGPAPDFSAHLRDRLVAVATVRPAEGTRPARAGHRARRAVVARLTVAAAGGAVVVAGLGAGTARALPGQPLYAAKREVESLQLDLRHGAASRGREQLAFARTRIGEVRALTQHHTLTAGGTGAGGTADAQVTRTLRTMDGETRAGARDLLLAASRGDAGAPGALIAFADAQTADLRALRPGLPSDAVPAAEASSALIQEVRGQAASLASAGTTPQPGDPSLAPTRGPGSATTAPTTLTSTAASAPRPDAPRPTSASVAVGSPPPSSVAPNGPPTGPVDASRSAAVSLPPLTTGPIDLVPAGDTRPPGSP